MKTLKFLKARLAVTIALLRHWKMVMALLALLVAAWTYGAKLRTERALERCRGEAAIAGLRLERAHQATEALRRDSRRRSAEQDRLLAEARQANGDEVGRMAELKRSAAAPRPGRRCPTSDPLRRSEKHF